VYRDMEQWLEIRRRVLVQGVSKRRILRETGMHWTTLEKILTQSEPPGYRQVKNRPKPRIGPWLGRIAAIRKTDQELPKKQRHSAKRLFERLREEGYQGGYTAVKDAVREQERQGREVFVPLAHQPGEAQVDFGEALIRQQGRLRKVKFFALGLPYSDIMFVMAFERECTETFWEGHVRAFETLAGVPHRITYDNTKIAVSQIVGPRERKLTHGFLQLKSHYLFDHHFCLVRRANEKGVVEGIVKYARQNFFVPVPEVGDLEELKDRKSTRLNSSHP
jgi:transposase